MNAPTAPQAPRATLTLEALNAATPEAAVMLLDGTYEHSPWVAQAALAERPFRSLPSRAAKHAGESKRGRQSQSIDPRRLTSAAVPRSPSTAYSSMGVGLSSRLMP